MCGGSSCILMSCRWFIIGYFELQCSIVAKKVNKKIAAADLPKNGESPLFWGTSLLASPTVKCPSCVRVGGSTSTVLLGIVSRHLGIVQNTSKTYFHLHICLKLVNFVSGF